MSAEIETVNMDQEHSAPYTARCRCGWEYAIVGSGDALVVLVTHLSGCIALRRPGRDLVGIGR